MKVFTLLLVVLVLFSGNLLASESLDDRQLALKGLRKIEGLHLVSSLDYQDAEFSPIYLDYDLNDLIGNDWDYSNNEDQLAVLNIVMGSAITIGFILLKSGPSWPIFFASVGVSAIVAALGFNEDLETAVVNATAGAAGTYIVYVPIWFMTCILTPTCPGR